MRPGKNSKGTPFYDPAAARELLKKHSEEIGVKCLPYEEMVYLANEDRYEQVTEIQPNRKVFSISGTQVRDNYLTKGRLLPSWFTRKETAEILSSAYPARQSKASASGSPACPAPARAPSPTSSRSC